MPPYQQTWNVYRRGPQMIRPKIDVSAHAYRDGTHVVLKLNSERYWMTVKEAVLLADTLVDATEQPQKEIPNA